jgi:hypothetical protein
MQARWRLLVLVCALASQLVPALASASTGPYAETRVRGFDLANPASARAERAVTLATHQGYALAYDDFASGYLLAARGGAAAVRAGQAGEAAVRAAVDIGPSSRILVNGANRIPDGLTDDVLSEVKNVQSLSYTQQLRDFTAFSQQTGRQFDLYVRPDTQLSGPLQQAVTNGDINLLFIPGP